MRSTVTRLARRLSIALIGSGALSVVAAHSLVVAQVAQAGRGENHCEPVVTL
jgi:hypothetical protein